MPGDTLAIPCNYLFSLILRHYNDISKMIPHLIPNISLTSINTINKKTELQISYFSNINSSKSYF